MPKQQTALSFLTQLHKRLLFIAFLLSLVIALVSSAAFFFLPPEVPLLYSLSLPEQQLIQKEGIFIIPGVAMLSLVSALFSLSYIKNLDPVVSTLVLWSQIVIQSLLLVITVRILVIIQ